MIYHCIFYIHDFFGKFGYWFRPRSVLILLKKNMLCECIGCIFKVGRIGGKCFGVEISENGKKRRYRVTFEPTG